MPPVLITCPITDDLIPTGVEVDDLVELEADNLLTACPVCGRNHEWKPADAVLAVPARMTAPRRSELIARRDIESSVLSRPSA